MAHDLEYPGTGVLPDADSLYRARGEEVVRHRPVFTGDVFAKVTVQSVRAIKIKDVIVVQHPCALRSNGVDLHPRLLVAEVRRHSLIPADDWTGHVGKMPLPDLLPTVESGRRHQAAFFDEPYLAGSDELDLDKRIACLSQAGVNILLQRWVNHNSRAVIPTFDYQTVSSPAFEEADIIEEWSEARIDAGLDLREALVEAMKWLREDSGTGATRQRLLEDPQSRSTVRQQMRLALRQQSSGRRLGIV
ncbi:MAG TPA: hypothetical protein VLJ59_10790 [Mycobacteriales bacterium]|nr:hypothetical protein [Mycobacteriales bacterium]